ncbi:hypothetical protein HYDPIDRAFT_29034 [Hydnomerulius pinastri MD-312]|uniref:Uncharacterized protein n=1 Tax=Hydnomerulius pinastri MD-312 TaxID=994086 RepID=A0A0C9W921_9AGAM|nr:hypothetical protein HYDPIDRAFT_29034 [Hydnomerulius pinastri MD-312]
MPPKANPSKSSRAKSSGPPADEGLLTRSTSMKTRSGSLYVAIPIKPKPKLHLKKKDPAQAVPLMEEEEFQETFNLAKCTQTGLILNVRSPQMSSEPTWDADDPPPSHKAKSKRPSMQSLDPDEDPDDDTDDLPPSRKAKSKCPSMQSRAPDKDLDNVDDPPPSRKAKSKRPSVQSRAPDEDLDNIDDPPPSRKAKSKRPSVQSRAPDEDPDDDAHNLLPSHKAKSKHPSVQSQDPDEDPDDDADDLPPSRKAKSKHPSVQSLDPINVDTDQPPSSRTEKSKCPPSYPQGPASNVDDADQPPPSCKEMSQHNNGDPDDDNSADVPPPSHHPSFRKESKCASPPPKSHDVNNNVEYSPPTPRANSRRRSTVTAHVSPTMDLEMDPAPNHPDQDNETLTEDEDVEQLVLGPDASSEDSHLTQTLQSPTLVYPTPADAL